MENKRSLRAGLGHRGSHGLIPRHRKLLSGHPGSPSLCPELSLRLGARTSAPLVPALPGGGGTAAPLWLLTCITSSPACSTFPQAPATCDVHLSSVLSPPPSQGSWGQGYVLLKEKLQSGAVPGSPDPSIPSSGHHRHQSPSRLGHRPFCSQGGSRSFPQPFPGPFCRRHRAQTLQGGGSLPTGAPTCPHRRPSRATSAFLCSFSYRAQCVSEKAVGLRQLLDAGGAYF